MSSRPASREPHCRACSLAARSTYQAHFSLAPQLLITHHISLCLGSADYVVRLSEGRVTLQGRVEELDKNELTTDLVEEDDKAGEADERVQKLAEKGKVDSKDPKEAEHAAALAAAGTSAPSSSSAGATPGTSTPVPGGEPASVLKRSGKLVDEEKRATGRVKWSVYNLYLRSAGYWTWVFMVALLFLGRAGRVADRAYFRYWGESYRVSDSLLWRMLLPSHSQLALVATDVQSFAVPHIPSPPSASDDVTFWLVGYTVICALLLSGDGNPKTDDHLARRPPQPRHHGHRHPGRLPRLVQGRAFTLQDEPDPRRLRAVPLL